MGIPGGSDEELIEAVTTADLERVVDRVDRVNDRLDRLKEQLYELVDMLSQDMRPPPTPITDAQIEKITRDVEEAVKRELAAKPPGS